jgi:hypothetical protein
MDIDIDNPSNSVGMSFLFNAETVSNSIKLDDNEKNIIDETKASFDNTFLSYEDPIKEYQEKAEMINNNLNPSSLNKINEIANFTEQDDDTYDEIQDDLDEINSLIGRSNSESQYQFFETEEHSNQKILTDIIKEETNIVNSNESVLLDNDKKILLLQKIEDLIEDLNCDGVDTSAIPNVNFKSSLDELDLVYRQLVIKNNRDRYRVLAEECFLIFAKGLEKVFDGDKEYFGYKPDLTDFSNTMRTKLRRFRYETTSMASDFVEHYELSMRSKLFLELGASAISHSISRKHKYKQNLFDENAMNSAMDEIRNNEDD